MNWFLLLAMTLSAAPPADSPQLLEPGRSITLEEAYRLSLKRSEEIAQSREAVNEALARIDELKSQVRPHISLDGTQTFQENPHSGIASLDKTSLSQAQITARQPLFSGFREFLAFKAGKKQAESLAFDARRVESLLYQDVAQAYLELLRQQNEIGIRQGLITATDERVKQLTRWIKIGRSRGGEALAVRAQLAQSQAQLEIARGAESMAQEALRFLTGLEEERLTPQEVAEPALEPIEPFLDRARRRPDVQARERELESAELSTKFYGRQRWPTVGLTADYYLKRSGGFTANTRYDAILAASLPLFDGGVTGNQVRGAKAREEGRRQAVSLAARAAERDVRAAYRDLQWTLAAVRALDGAVKLAEENVDAQTEDYRLSRVSNLEVLDGLNTLQATRLALNQTRLQAALARARLEAAAGGPAPAPGDAR